jgi:hypothetical protein
VVWSSLASRLVLAVPDVWVDQSYNVRLGCEWLSLRTMYCDLKGWVFCTWLAWQTVISIL